VRRARRQAEQKRVLLAEEKPRDRIYSSDEIRAIFAALPGTQLEDLVPLIFHTATRSEETRAATWSQIDFDARLWTIPPERSKNGKAHLVPLSSGAMKALDRIRERQAARPSEYLFAAFSRAGHMEKPNKATRRMQQPLAFGGSGIEDFPATRLPAHGCNRPRRARDFRRRRGGRARPRQTRVAEDLQPLTGTNARAEVIPLSA
jgi:integrase